MNTEQQKKPPASVEITVRTQIAAVAATATTDERAAVKTLIEKAKTTAYSAVLMTLSPAMCAILFLEHNPHNRDWRPLFSLDLARQIREGQWQWNNATLGFYTTGELQDGQHRLAAKALAGEPWESIVVFGVQHQAIVTTDTGARRTAGDAAKLEGMTDAKRKRSIVMAASSYLVKSGEKDAALKSEPEVLKHMNADNELLDAALSIGQAGSDKNKFVSPVLDENQCATLAYLLLSHGWTDQDVRNHLASFQSGMSKDGERTPFFVAAQWITDSRKSREAASHLSRTKELGVVVLALRLTVEGVTAVQKKRFQEAVRREMPDPRFPVVGDIAVA